MHGSMCIHENTTCDCLLKEHLLGRWIGLSSRWLLFCVHGLILYEQFNGPALSEAPSMLPALFETRGVVAGIDYKTSEAGVTSRKTTSCDVPCLKQCSRHRRRASYPACLTLDILPPVQLRSC